MCVYVHVLFVIVGFVVDAGFHVVNGGWSFKLVVALLSSKPKLFVVATIGAFVSSAVAVCRRLEPSKPLPVALDRRFPKPWPLFAAPQVVAAICRTPELSPQFFAVPRLKD
ncbi:hypothetical protein Syun_014020 [Stephania yunnanensis]|uniref:Uncharacterized protein n=1 Tax=Stephania yunnanensis TaxID=152371 RepID=A0AAP0JJB3_9MAGN